MLTFLEVRMLERPRHPLSAYGVALMATAVTLALRWLLWPVLGDSIPFMGFFPAVIIAAYFGGLWPGLLTTLLSTVAADYFILQPRFSFRFAHGVDFVGLVLFVVTSAMLTILSEALHRGRNRLVSVERQRGEEMRREAEERFRQLVENIHEVFWMSDAQGQRMLYASPGYERIYGRTCQSLYERPASRTENIHPDDRNRVIEQMEHRRDGLFIDLEFRIVRPDGSIRWVRNRAFPIKDENGHLSRIAGLMEDITDRKRVEGELRESEQRWRSITEALPQLVWTARSDGYVDYQSTQFGEYFGVPEDKMLGWQWLELLHPGDRERTRLAWQAAIERDSDYDLEVRLRRFDGVYRWFKTRGVRIRDRQGRTLKWFGTCTDITDGKLAEEALRESEHRWRSLTEALPQLVWTALPDGACDYFSTQWTQYTGVPTSELLGWQWMKTLHPDDRESTRQFWTDSVAGRHDYDVEYRVRRSDGEYRWFKTRGVPIRDSGGSIFKWFGTCTDITDGKHAAAELRVAKEAAESANRAKDEFLANVSHEIRTPMNAIMGLTSLVLGTDLNDGQRQSLATVKSAANNLLGIINDLLDFSKIEAGKLELSVSEFWLRAALGDTLRALAVRAHQKGLELVSNVHPEVPDALTGDAGRLRQVLLNLIGNAIKFTEKGEVVVQVLSLSDVTSNNDEVRLLFTVRDTGIGIPKEKQVAIFRAFEQEDSSTTRKYGGTGLGLTISAQLAALMGGEITVESEPGRGSTFSFTARFGRSSKRAGAGAGASSDLLDNLRVLIVDDNVTNRQILEEWLHNWRMRPVAVGDGAAALDALRHAAEAGVPYSLVLLDGRMPDGDGLTVARQIREDRDISSTRIILLPSEDSSISIAHSREMGISAYLLKPVQQSELLETISRVMGRTTADDATAKVAAATPESRALTAMAEPLHILVAEDNEFNVILLEQLFGQRGHIARFASDGQEAVKLAMEGRFDVLLLDIHMPKMDGFAVAQAIREQERSSGHHLPIIAFTARAGKTDRERCLAAGMDDFLSKPVQAEALWQVIDRVVAANAPEHQPDSGLLDPRTILGACAGEAAILERICRTFQTSVPNQMARVRAAMNDNDAPRLREATHLLRGTLSAFSTVAGSAASNLEEMAARGQIEECAPLVTRLESICSALVEQTRNLSIEKLGS
jgi:PAS domain S-box-containing protein